MQKKRFILVSLLMFLLVLAACGGQEPAETTEPAQPAVTEVEEPAAEEEAEPEPEPTEEAAEVEAEPEAEPTEVPVEEEAEAEAEPAEYTGPVTEIAIRRLNPTQDIVAFADARSAYIEILKNQEGADVDAEFAPFVDFLTFAAPDPAVYIGMTEYTDMAAFEAASSAAGSTDEAAAFFSTFNPEVFSVLRPLNPADRYDLAELAIEPGQVLEVAVRDLSSYENFDQAAYEETRDAFLAALSEQEGWVRELQWVSMFDPNIVVGMTVYESAPSYFAIYSSDFGTSEITNAFSGGYPLQAGFASLKASEVPLPTPSLSFGADVFVPESVAVHDGFAYTSNFFDGAIHRTELATGATVTLVEAGNDGAIAGWGVWYDTPNNVLLACLVRNAGFGIPENVNGARAIDPETGEILETWTLPEGSACNSLVAVENGDIYISDVSPNADIVKIDRATGEASIWIDEPAWENDSGFGVGGLAWDGGSNLYAAANGVTRLTINEDGTAGAYQTLNMVDAAGEPTFFSFDGFAHLAENGKLYGASFDQTTFQTQVVEATLLDEDTVQAQVVSTTGVAITGIDADSGTVYAADGQLIQFLFTEGYEPALPFQLYVIAAE